MGRANTGFSNVLAYFAVCVATQARIILTKKKMVSDSVQCEDAVSLSLHNAGSLDKKESSGAARLQALKGASLQRIQKYR